MTTTEIIVQRLKSLPASAQREVLDFVEFLQSHRQEHTARKDEVAWSAFSLDSRYSKEDFARPGQEIYERDIAG
ncbi:MAG: DUF2281 domain-containing protein [Candidatus Methylomirabilis oxyfera]|nr:DUF2281 domain-containing protein [Candidatus Methylomirabilis oxyfera]